MELAYILIFIFSELSEDRLQVHRVINDIEVIWDILVDWIHSNTKRLRRFVVSQLLDDVYAEIFLLFIQFDRLLYRIAGIQTK